MNSKITKKTLYTFAIITLIFISIPIYALTQEKTRAELLKQKRLEKSQNLKPYKASNLEKLLLFIEHNPFKELLVNGVYGFMPVVGGLKSGSGVGGGIKFEPTKNLDHLHFELRILGSFKSYEDYKAAFGYEQNRLSLFSFAEFRSSPQDNFYGIGDNALKSDRTNFQLKDSKLGGVFSFRPCSSIRTFFQGTYLHNKIGPGTSDEYLSIEEKFQPETVPGLDDDTEFYIGSIGIILDFRGEKYRKYLALKQSLLDNPLDLRGANPFKGMYLFFKASRYENKSNEKYDFNRYDLEFQQYFPFFQGHRVIAFRHFISIVDKNGNADVPFYLLQPLGGSMSIRGFQEFRFRDRNSLLFNIEYRWYAWSGLDMALFYDAGNVFPHYKDMTFKNMKTSYGIGFHFNSKTSLPLRIDIAYGDEGAHFIIKFSNIF